MSMHIFYLKFKMFSFLIPLNNHETLAFQKTNNTFANIINLDEIHVHNKWQCLFIAD